LSILVAHVLALASIAVLVLYVNHIGRSLRVAALIELVGSDTRRLLDEQYPQPADQPADPRVVLAERSGVLTNIDVDRIVQAMHAAGCTARLRVGLGEFVPAGAVLFDVDGAVCTEHMRAELDVAVRLELERTLDRDVAYGFRLLVDIAERSVAESPFQDPTTAVQAIDRLHDCLRHLAPRRFPHGRHLDDGGQVRLTMPVMSWDDFVRLAFEEISLAGAGSPQVERRLLAAIDDLEDVAEGDRLDILHDYRQRLQSSRSHGEHDENEPIHADPHGIGLGS
jgi:uncharacterized membrane protein